MSIEIDYNAVASYERTKQTIARGRGIRFFMPLLTAVFFIVLMIGLVVGVAMYQTVANSQTRANEARMQTGLLVSNIHANDTVNAVAAGKGPEGRALVLSERATNGNTYEVRIYLYQGNIVEEYAIAGAAYSPERAEKLVPSKTFDFKMSGSLLTLFTDQGETDVALRSWQGGGA